MQKIKMRLAERNIGRLIAPPGDPRIAAFVPAIDRAPAGHRPSLDAGPGRWEQLTANGDGDHAFARSHLSEAKLLKHRGSCPAAAS